MLEHIPGSSTKYIAITGISFNVYRLKNTGAILVGFEELIKNQHIYSCANDLLKYVLKCIFIAKNIKKIYKFRKQLY
jgi:hypothetical protein